MEKNVHDLALDEMHKRRRLVKEELVKRYKGKRPFRMEHISNDDLLLEYETKGEEIFSKIANKQGLDAGISYINEMDALKRKRGL